MRIWSCAGVRGLGLSASARSAQETLLDQPCIEAELSKGDEILSMLPIGSSSLSPIRLTGLSPIKISNELTINKKERDSKPQTETQQEYPQTTEAEFKTVYEVFTN